jgi:broad specificity phosphatase PhoE
VRLFVLTRHGESELNITRRVNGDPDVAVHLSAHGREQARVLGEQVAQVPLDVCVHTRFDRTLESAQVALEGRDVPLVEEPLLDDVYIGELEGWTIDEYRGWKAEHGRSDCFPGGESLDDAARRYARGYEALLALPHARVLVVCHEIPVRYAVNAGAGSDDLDGPVHDIVNAAPYLFDEAGVRRAIEGVRRLVP